MTKFDESKTYWENNGRYKKQDSKLWEKYIPNKGVNLTANSAANKAILEYRTFSAAYRSFYNNGSGINSPRFYIASPSFEKGSEESDMKKMIKLERQMNKIILRAWKATKGAKLPVVLESYDVELPSYRRD